MKLPLTWRAFTYVTRRLNCLRATPPSFETVCSCLVHRNLRCSILRSLEPDIRAFKFHRDRSILFACITAIIQGGQS